KGNNNDYAGFVIHHPAHLQSHNHHNNYSPKTRTNKETKIKIKIKIKKLNTEYIWHFSLPIPASRDF
ncbi:MAG: hypothetical protein IKR70_04550, partial [Lachnospiraceae bacterium]|nr:hypothetical protein [Lachnospiraceae bacterium]